MGLSVAAPPFPYSPYCGAPPTPTSLLVRWNLDPWLLAGLGFALVGYLWATKGRTYRGRPPRLAFVAGWVAAALCLTSPLCALSVALFSARVGQHLILVTLAAPLVAMGLPRLRLLGGGTWLSTAAFTATLWFWHAPGPYRATFDGPVVYWLMHATLFGSAVWLWAEALTAWRSRHGNALIAIALAGGQMGLLGAVLTFLPRSIYGVHTFTTIAWGLTPLQDQQLGGAFMWAPGGAITAAALTLMMAAVLGATGARRPAGAAA